MPTFSLYLIRHGVAAERGEEYPDDSKRPLTAQGISRLRKEAQALDALGVTFDQIITSPLVRTRQTADVFAESLKAQAGGRDVRRAGARRHAGGGDAGTRQARARRAASRSSGHEPNLGELAARLIGARTAARVQEGRRLPHRLRDVAAQGQRQAALVRHAADAAQARLTLEPPARIPIPPARS